MRARAQKKKRASGEVEETTPSRTPAAGPSQSPADASPGVAADRRVIPDPQGPPVVAPVLMPAVMLSDREGVAAEAVATLEAAGAGSIAPVAEALMSAGAPPQPSTQRHQDGRSSDGQTDAPTPSAPPQHAAAVDAPASADEEWRGRDEARLLVQSPRRLFLYWRFARDPRELLRAALGPVADRLGPAVRLVDEATGEEGAPAPADGGDYWFDVLPGRLLRAEVGFHGEGLPFVRLISSNTVETPAGGVSGVADEAPEFRVGRQEFERVLEATGFAADAWQAERARRDEHGGDPARPLDHDPSRADDPLRARASSDTARPASSPREGNHFSSPRDGSHFSNTRGGESNARGGGEVF